MVFQRSMLPWRRGWGQSAIGICALCYIYIGNLFGVKVFQRSMLNWRRGGVNLPWVYVHCAIYETYLVSWFSRDLCLIGEGGWGQSAIGICALCYINMKLIWCKGFPEIYASRSAKFGVAVFRASMLD